MVKAALINGAYDMGTADIPNNNEGWGRINLGNVIDSGVLTAHFDQQTLFTDTGNTWSFAATVVDPSKPFKVSLVWSDPPGPGTGGTTPAWVNDLNLTVTQGGNTYRGNVFLSGWSTTGGAADTRNNIENVYIQTPTGTYNVTISAANIAGDGVPYNGDTTDQDWALVCYNCALGPTPTPTPTITPGGPTFTPTSTRTPTPTRTNTPTPVPRCGTPDPFGYRCDDQVTRTWITATVNAGITQDDQAVGVVLPFAFTFYGASYTSVNISSNGNIHFGTLSTAYSNVCIPNTGVPNAMIAALWDDLYPPAGGAIYYGTTGTAPNRVFTVEWRNIQHFSGTPSGATFEIQLLEGANEWYILYPDTIFGTADDNGASATTGSENATGTVGLQYSCNQAVVPSGLVVRYYLSGAVTPTVTPTRTNTPTSTPIPPTPTPTPASYTFPLAPELSDISIPLDVSASGITDAESLADYVEAQGGSPPGSVQQLLKWHAPSQNFLSWSHEFQFGDNFSTQTGDYVFLLLSGSAPSSVTLTGRVPSPGEVQFALTPGQPSPGCFLNMLSLPFDQSALTNADQLSDDIGGVLQALSWDTPNQNFLTWSNEFGFGDNFATAPGQPYIVCLDNTAPTLWP
jgi:hypothetical protein